MFKIASWNVNSIKVRLDHVLSWLQSNQPDVLAMQEIKCVDEQFPYDAFAQLGYQSVVSGQKTYNGVAILSRKPCEVVQKDIPTLDDPQRRILVATLDGVTVVNCYVPNGSEVDSDKYQYKLQWLAAMTQYCQQLTQQTDKIIILGDFNIAPEDADVHDPKKWQGSVLVSPPERAAWQTLLQQGFIDSFRQFQDHGVIYSWWDYRRLAYQKNQGLRIDHILISEAMLPNLKSSWIDKAPRKLERPSDHAPVIAEFSF